VILKITFDLLKQTVTDWLKHKAARLAAALAYYMVFSLAPLLIILVGVAGMIFGQDIAANYLSGQFAEMTGGVGTDVTTQIIKNADEQRNSGLIATMIGFGMLLLGASGVFGQLQDALNTIWEVPPRPDGGLLKMAQDRFMAFTMVLGVGFLLVASIVLSTALTTVSGFIDEYSPLRGSLATGQYINLVASFAITVLLFAVLYRALPDVKLTWGDVWLGAVGIAVLFTLGKQGLAIYLGRASFNSTYGAAGSILVLLVWIYYSTQIFLLGAEFTQVYTRRFGSHARRAAAPAPVLPPGQATATTEEPVKPNKYSIAVVALFVIGVVIGALRRPPQTD
jgi:membrane protein